MRPARLVLASTSPRRRELLGLLNISFELASPEVPEMPADGESPADMVGRLSRAKAWACANVFPEAVVLAADTVVALDGRILGKPEDAAEAVRMLKALRARAHQVFSGVAVVGPGIEELAIIETSVWMRDYSDDEIERYVQSGDPLDKAGAYAIQNPNFHPVARLEGCPTNVMGLPLCQVDRILRRPGILQHATPVQTCCPPFFCALSRMANDKMMTHQQPG